MLSLRAGYVLRPLATSGCIVGRIVPNLPDARWAVRKVNACSAPRAKITRAGRGRGKTEQSRAAQVFGAGKAGGGHHAVAVM